jgi:cupin 2 domain-containing protein
MQGATNLFDDLPDSPREEQIRTLLNAPGTRIERIVSHGHCSPPGFWYDQAEDEWLLVVRGKARLQFDGEPSIELGMGSYLHIPARLRHRVEWTDAREPTVWLAVHFPGGDPATR